MMHRQKSINKVSSLQPPDEGLERKLEGKYVGGLVGLLKEIESTNREISESISEMLPECYAGFTEKVRFRPDLKMLWALRIKMQLP